MIHPDTEPRLLESDIGYGVTATAEIPAATIVWADECNPGGAEKTALSIVCSL